MIVFSSDGNIYTMHLDGTSLTQLTNTGQDFTPSFSPDGTKILFESSREERRHIFIMDSDGSDVKKISYNLPFGRDPSFIPE